MNNNKLVSGIYNDKAELSAEDKIKLLLKNFDKPLPVKAIAILTGLDRRKVYSKLNKMQKWHEARRVSRKEVEYWKLVDGDSNDL